MPQEFTFDIVSNVDLQAIDDAVNTANKEIFNRFDFKGSASRIDYDKKQPALSIISDNDGKLKSVIDVLESRLIKRGVSLKALSYEKIEQSLGGQVKQTVKILQGLSTEKAKEIVRAIKDSKLKVIPSIQGNQVRVSSRNKDDLQTTISQLRAHDFGVALQFVNFR